MKIKAIIHNIYKDFLLFKAKTKEYICHGCYPLRMCRSSANRLLCLHNSGISPEITTFEFSFGRRSYVVIKPVLR